MKALPAARRTRKALRDSTELPSLAKRARTHRVLTRAAAPPSSSSAQPVQHPQAKPFVTVDDVKANGGHAMAADGLKTIQCSYGPKETMNRLEAEVKAKGLTIFAHVDHAAGAAEVGLPLRPTD